MADVSSTPSVTSLLQHCHIIVTSAVSIKSCYGTPRTDAELDFNIPFLSKIFQWETIQVSNFKFAYKTNKEQDKTRKQF